jgi:D-arabinose 1-dehydrogenase-like Zn-dependent alcohol dehydrogenase
LSRSFILNKSIYQAFMPKMRAVQVSQPNGPFEIVEREIPTPSFGRVRIKIQACGICHSDSIVKEGLFPHIQYPKIPGHEIAGVIDSIGGGVTEWSVTKSGSGLVWGTLYHL